MKKTAEQIKAEVEAYDRECEKLGFTIRRGPYTFATGTSRPAPKPQKAK